MGIFDGIFGARSSEDEKEEKKVPWIPLTSLDGLTEIEKRSLVKTQVIFKHSTTCGISRMVINMFNDNYNCTKEQLDLYYLDLHAYREVSNETGYKFQVVHQSPQLLIIKNGTTIAHASHGAITEVDLEKYV